MQYICIYIIDITDNKSIEKVWKFQFKIFLIYIFI